MKKKFTSALFLFMSAASLALQSCEKNDFLKDAHLSTGMLPVSVRPPKVLPVVEEPVVVAIMGEVVEAAPLPQPIRHLHQLTRPLPNFP